MSNLKMGKKDAPQNASKRSEKLQHQPISKRISDFLIEEGKKEKLQEEPKKKIAKTPQRDLDL